MICNPQVWTNVGDCDASEGRRGTIKQVLKLGEEELGVVRTEFCFNAIKNGIHILDIKH